MRVWVEKGSRKVNVDSNGVILKGYDTVAYFTQKKAVKGSSKYESTYQGAIYYFSSAADLATFKRNPSKNMFRNTAAFALTESRTTD